MKGKRDKSKRADAPKLVADASGHLRVPVWVLFGNRHYAQANMHEVPRNGQVIALDDDGCQWLVHFVTWNTAGAQAHVVPANPAAAQRYLAVMIPPAETPAAAPGPADTAAQATG